VIDRTRRVPRIGPPGDPDVFLSDEQGEHAVDGPVLRNLALAVLADEGVGGDVELNLLFVDSDQIADLNRHFLGEPGPTDVLAFPIDEGEPLEPGRHPDGSTSGPQRENDDPEGIPLLLGDVVICPAVAATSAPGHAGTLADELALLVVHGTLHVLGHDHAELSDRETMQRRERELLKRHHTFATPDGTPPSTTWPLA